MAWGDRWSWRGKLALVLVLGLGGYVGLGWFVFGLRMPPLQWEPDSPPSMMESEDGLVFLEASGASFVGHEDGWMVFRAFVPEPLLIVSVRETTEARVRLLNLHPKATTGAIEAVAVDGLQRDFRIPLKPGIGMVLQARMPAAQDSIRFAAIGDTGGGAALEQAVQRAAELKVDFLLHLGDIEYAEGDLERAAEVLAAAPFPTYVAIGNHDFHAGLSLIHKRFTRLFGPRNSSFEWLGLRFLNLDTAADHYPAGGGERGELMESLLSASGGVPPTVLFTHSPLRDPRPGESHDIGHQAEIDWLQGRLAPLGVVALLHGHIHQTLRDEIDDIPVHIVGNGLRLPEEHGAEAPGLLLGEWRGGMLDLRVEPLE